MFFHQSKSIILRRNKDGGNADHLNNFIQASLLLATDRILGTQQLPLLAACNTGYLFSLLRGSWQSFGGKVISLMQVLLMVLPH